MIHQTSDALDTKFDVPIQESYTIIHNNNLSLEIEVGLVRILFFLPDAGYPTGLASMPCQIF